MNTQTQTYNATARPWKVWQDDEFLTPPIQIIDASGRIIAKTNMRDEQTDNANAALIVRAVNEYDALCAVAEAAFHHRNIWQSSKFSKNGKRLSCIALDKAIATLIALRGDGK